jgi:branched-chain amino acid aminotransferase
MVKNMNIEILDRETNVKIPENLVFGRVFTDHMFEIDFDSNKGGWHDPKIKKRSNLEMSPAAMVFHYGQAIFEGLKAYKQEDGRIALFRPDKNVERLNRSARRICIPEVDPDLALRAILELVSVDRDWIPKRPGYSLYIRPFIFASEPGFGVHAAHSYKFIILLSPVGPYYPEGFKPVPILVTDQYVRTVRKGTGEAKTAGNYAASLLAQAEAEKEGYSQILWLDAVEQKYIEEVGAMNMFVQFKNEVATPSLTGSILPGVTRMSVLQILKDWGYNVTERLITIQEILESYDSGNLIEIFGTGTAAVISSVSKLKYNDRLLKFGDENPGELGTKLYNELTGIQSGRIPDRYGWMTYLK